MMKSIEVRVAELADTVTDIMDQLIKVMDEQSAWTHSVTSALLKVSADHRSMDERIKQLEEEVAWNKHQLGLDQAERSA